MAYRYAFYTRTRKDGKVNTHLTEKQHNKLDVIAEMDTKAVVFGWTTTARDEFCPLVRLATGTEHILMPGSSLKKW